MSRFLDDLFQTLSIQAEQLTKELGRPVSLNETLLRLVKSMNLQPGDFSWSWRIDQARLSETFHEKNPTTAHPSR